MTINISKDMKTATLTDGCVLYTEDGKTFTQVDTSTGYLLSITQPGPFREAFLSAATWGPVPEGARFEYEAGAPEKQRGAGSVRDWSRRYANSKAAHVIGWVAVGSIPLLLGVWLGYAMGVNG